MPCASGQLLTSLTIQPAKHVYVRCILNPTTALKRNDFGSFALLLLEGKAYGFLFRSSNRCLLILCSQLFLPRRDRVRTRRQVLQFEVAVFVRNRKKRMLENSNIALHPGMHVAFDWNRNLLASERLLQGNPVRLSHVPLAIIARGGMNVMRGFIAVHDFELLMGLHCEHVRLVLATLLFEDRRPIRRLKRLRA